MFTEWETYCIFKEYIRVFFCLAGKVCNIYIFLEEIFNLQTEISHSEKKSVQESHRQAP